MTIDNFRNEVLKLNVHNEWEVLHFIRKFIFHGLPHVFNGNEDKYFEFRNRIAEHFKIGFQEVFIIGSSKLGFNYFKEKSFDYDSDIDVVIVNEEVFDQYMLAIRDYQYSHDKTWKTMDEKSIIKYHNFLRYIAKGWIRPDLLPLRYNTKYLSHEWFDFYDSISYGRSEVGDYKVTAGIFKNYDYLARYHYTGILNYYYKLKAQQNVNTDTISS